MLAGDVDSGKTMLHDYIKATSGFAKLGAETGASPKSLMRMFSVRGNPQARTLHYQYCIDEASRNSLHHHD